MLTNGRTNWWGWCCLTSGGNEVYNGFYFLGHILSF